MGPILVFISNYFMENYLTGEDSKVDLALQICLFQVVVAALSFLGDYWFQSTAEEGTPGRSGYIRPANPGVELEWWQKTLLCNKIDWLTAVTSGIMLAGLCIIQLCYSCDPWFYAPLLPMLAVAVASKFHGTALLRRYGETHDPSDLWWHLFWHSVWHIIGSVLSIFLIHGLMVDGFETPVWLS